MKKIIVIGTGHLGAGKTAIPTHLMGRLIESGHEIEEMSLDEARSKGIAPNGDSYNAVIADDFSFEMSEERMRERAEKLDAHRKLSDMKIPDMKIPDMKIPDMKIPDMTSISFPIRHSHKRKGSRKI